AGTQTVCLGGPAGTNFDVALQRWTGTSWRTVAAGAGVTSAETVTYTGSAGRYQLKVLARTGTGTYTAAVG
ncbi:MAG TPA: hypothetical protein VFY17_02645, partial [Pilimelia sp.]|nr:hypothetical protein [Pilimelia sp.]